MQHIRQKKWSRCSVAGFFFVVGCGSGDLRNSGQSVVSQQPSYEDPYCIQSAEQNIERVCLSFDDVWQCESVGKDQTSCTHTPNGGGGWRCYKSSEVITCQSTTSGSNGGGAWMCSTEGDTVVCSIPQDDEQLRPMGPGSWDCRTSTEGIVCVGQHGSEENENDTYPFPEPGDFRTQTPGGWGAPARGNNPGVYREHISRLRFLTD